MPSLLKLYIYVSDYGVNKKDDIPCINARLASYAIYPRNLV